MKNITCLILLLFLAALSLHAQKHKTVLYQPVNRFIDPALKSQISMDIYLGGSFEKYNTSVRGATTGRKLTTSFGGGAGIGLRYGRLITKQLQISLGAYYQGEGLDGIENVSGGVSKANLSPNVRYFLPVKNSRSRFYAGAGLLISCFTTFTLKETLSSGKELDYKFKYKTAIGPTVEIGWEVYVRSTISIDLGIRYHYLYYSMDQAVINGEPVSLSLVALDVYSPFLNPSGEGIDVIAGLRYAF